VHIHSFLFRRGAMQRNPGESEGLPLSRGIAESAPMAFSVPYMRVTVRATAKLRLYGDSESSWSVARIPAGGTRRSFPTES